MENNPNETFQYLCNTIQDFSDCMDDFLYVYDLVNDQYYISPTALNHFCITEALFSNVGETHRQFVYEKDYDTLMEDLQKVIDGKIDDHNLIYRWLDKEKKPVWINCRGKSIRGQDGTPLFMVGCINELGRYPVADKDSGLLTSVMLKDFFNPTKTKSPLGFIMCMSIDDLHHLNEWDGVDRQIAVIHEVVDAINLEKSETQRVYRFLKDQFVIVDNSSTSLAEAKELFSRIQDRIARKIEENDYQVLYTVSAGIISDQDTGKLNYSTMLNVAQFILEKMKEQGAGTVYSYKEADYHEFLEKRHLLSELRKSMLNHFDRYELFFQPVVDGKTKSIVSAEGLLRFYRKDGTMVSPAYFIPLLESSGMIVPVGRWIIYQALDVCKKCREYLPSFKVSVNVSYIQVLKSNIVETIEKALSDCGMPSDCLVVEMTESGHLEHSAIVKKVWSKLKGLGVRIALDDFGTGYSNLTSIGILQPDIIKLDREFTTKAVTNAFEHQLMHNIIELTHSLQLSVCIEGIENPQELSMVDDMSANYIQGFFFGKPCRASELVKQLEENTGAMVD